ncbi:MAG: DUF4349 domain-containing protein [Chitinophagales bacterium]
MVKTKTTAMKRLPLLLFTLIFFGCQNKAQLPAEASVEQKSSVMSSVAVEEPSGNYKRDESATTPGQDLPIAAQESTSVKTATQIIKNANVQFQVKELERSHERIAALVKQYAAYFGSDNKATSSYQIESNLVIRVPAAQFDKLMEELMRESIYTNYMNITAEDVTAQFVDIQARLKTKKEVEQRYIALLKQSNKVADILEVEDKLRVIREEIEAAEGRLKLLKDQVGYSTITLNMYQKLDYTPEPETGFFSNLKEAFVRGWRSLVDLLIVLVRVWPFLIIWGIGMVFVYRRYMKKK